MISSEVHGILTTRQRERWERYQQILSSPAPTPADAEWLADLCTDGHLSLADVGADESFLRDDQRLVKLYREAKARLDEANTAEERAAADVASVQNDTRLTGQARPWAISKADGRRANMRNAAILLQADANAVRLQVQKHRQSGHPRLRLDAINII